jgi:hypothetical protein
LYPTTGLDKMDLADIDIDSTFHRVAEVFEQVGMAACKSDAVECFYKESGEFIIRVDGKIYVFFLKEVSD